MAERISPSPASFQVHRQAYGPEALQFGELFVPNATGPHPLVILIHGGFWRVPYDLSLMTGLAEDLARHEVACWNIEYRRVGDKQGGWPQTLLDVAAAADFVRELAPDYNLDLQRVVSVGHSAGGHLAFWLAGRAQIATGDPLASASPLALAAAVSLAGVVDLTLSWRLRIGSDAVADLLGASPEAHPERYQATSPALLIPLGVPQLLLHGTKDDRVPLQVSQAYVEKAIAAGDQAILIELANVDHFALIDPHSPAWQTCFEAMRGLLG